MSEAALAQRQTAALKHGAYSSISATQLRQRRLRRKVRALKAQYPHLQSAPDHMVQRYVEIDLIAAQVFASLADTEVEAEDGAPRRLLLEYGRLLRQLNRLAESLGLLGQPEADPLAALGIDR